MIIYIKHGINYEHIEVTNLTNSNRAEAIELQSIRIYTKGQPIFIYNVNSSGHDESALEKKISISE